MLCSYLKKKVFLLILDDMWMSLELQSLGVSLKERGSKLVLTTQEIARQGVQGFATGHKRI